MDESFWTDFPSKADYFSPAITSSQKYLGVGSKEFFRSMGEAFGRKMAERFNGWEVEDILSELCRIWEKMDIGRFEVVSTDPLTLMVTNCRVCGQLAGTGGTYVRLSRGLLP